MILWFVHGWGFDSGLWSRLAQQLPDHRKVIADLGYFGREPSPAPTEPFIAVTHSFGTMRVLRDGSPACRGLVALNGFDRFTARDGQAGVPRRVLDRMIGRFAEAPAEVLADFRRRCGAESQAPIPAPDVEHLAKDLVALRDMDCTADAARWPVPILSLQGGTDPILPAGLRDQVFASAARIERATHSAAGHLLPLTEPDWCAQQIAPFIETCNDQ